MVDAARVIKRMRPAPQGRGYRVRKRSNHVTVVVDLKGNIVKPGKVKQAEAVAEIPAEAVTVKEKAAPKKKAAEKK